MRKKSYWYIELRDFYLSSHVVGHALAVDTDRNVFFDPNYGEARFLTSDALKMFMKAYFRQMYPAITGSFVALCYE